ncbi:hypothetical protein KSP40_PGU001580 [Platanthera guangdongensis]|uniref:Uncharacterized protein n=1 Tax=Platanthera guangdongensis TaxID=2320717 RepID=A0ABR2M5Z6_9ASPA
MIGQLYKLLHYLNKQMDMIASYLFSNLWRWCYQTKLYPGMNAVLGLLRRQNSGPKLQRIYLQHFLKLVLIKH